MQSLGTFFWCLVTAIVIIGVLFIEMFLFLYGALRGVKRWAEKKISKIR